MTPERWPTSRGRSTLVRPTQRRRLYWTARAVLVSDPAQVAALRPVFFAVFGDGEPRRLRPRRGAHRRPRRRRAPAPSTEPRAATGTRARRAPRARRTSDAEVEVPLAMASDEERLADKRFDALEPHELAQLYRLMTRLRSRPRAAHAPLREGAATASTSTCAARCAPACAPGGDPIRLARGAGASSAAGS
jgi:uncharacterized protein with von Willebrand factor type A (vWA) domain